MRVWVPPNPSHVDGTAKDASQTLAVVNVDRPGHQLSRVSNPDVDGNTAEHRAVTVSVGAGESQSLARDQSENSGTSSEPAPQCAREPYW